MKGCPMAKDEFIQGPMPTPVGSVRFPYVFSKDDRNGKYTITLLFDEEAQQSEAFTALKKTLDDAARARFGVGIGESIKGGQVLEYPFKTSADSEFIPEGSVQVKFKTKNRPEVVDSDAKTHLDEEAFYAGCLARVGYTAFGYDMSGNRGVSLLFDVVQKCGAGKPLGSKRTAASYFDAVETNEEPAEIGAGDTDF